MDKHRVHGKHPRHSADSTGSGRRSISNRSKTRKTIREHRESKELNSAIVKKELVDQEQNTSLRESITESFFESFFSCLVVSKEVIKPNYFEASFNATVGVNVGKVEFSNDSYTTVSDIEGSTTRGSEGSAGTGTLSIASKDTRSQTLTYTSVQSTESATGCPSCAATCTCYWKLTFKNGNFYQGQLHGSLMEGRGIFCWMDGSIYKGDFKEGHPCGQGTLILPDLSVYKGEFSLGFFHGNGNFNIKSTSMLYDGEWKLSQRHGKGWFLYNTDNWYDGDWVNSEKHGYGSRQYANGNKYNGNWRNDRISGEGCMMWHNNDYYTGEWREGYQQGYGEYTWNLIAHDKFVFPNYNWYKGNWNEGKRSGTGIMNFGHESGAKLAGMWQGNKKNGPGVMICGNGMVIEKNPLFTDDKPSTYIKEQTHTSYTTDKYNYPSLDSIDPKESVLKTYQKISKQVFSRENLEALDDESLTEISKNGSTIKMHQYIKLLERGTDNECPLKIPIHNVIHDVDLEHFVQDFFQPGISPYTKGATDVSTMEIQHIIQTRTGSSLVSPSCFNYLPSTAELSASTMDTVSKQCLPNSVELKNLIINYMPQLRNVYKMYAALGVEQEELPFEPVLVRLFLWQLYRDIGLTDKGGLSIVEVDDMLMKNPKSCLEAQHNPWEPIYFWQFLQALVGVACLLFMAENGLDYTPSSGFMYHMFKDFLDHKFLLRAGVFQGNCFTHLKDLIPIEPVYTLYKEIGEPHTVEEFINATCLKQDQKVPCYRAINQKDDLEVTIPTGTNIVVLNHQLSYLEDNSVKISLEHDKQKSSQGLYAFSKLGRKAILNSLAKICPQIVVSPKRYEMQYRLSFIEFYEIMLLLAYDRVEQDRLRLIEEMRGSMSEVKSSTRDMSMRMSSHSTKKKKFKK